MLKDFDVDFSLSYFIHHEERAVIFSLRGVSPRSPNLGEIAKLYGGGRETTAGFKAPLDRGFGLIQSALMFCEFPYPSTAREC